VASKRILVATPDEVMLASLIQKERKKPSSLWGSLEGGCVGVGLLVVVIGYKNILACRFPGNDPYNWARFVSF
jgi:hypothetical protein